MIVQTVYDVVPSSGQTFWRRTTMGLAVGFIGLGRMGTPISERLVAAGHTVRGMDVRPVDETWPKDVTPAETMVDLARGADVVVLSLPVVPASIQVCEDIAALEEADRPTIVVEISTIGPATAVRCAETLAAAGIAYVDAPVSGGAVGARSGRLTLMIGADQSVVDRVASVLDVIGDRRFVVGERAGQGQVMKLVNNFTSQTILAATSEATVLGARYGLSLEQMVEVINVSTARSAVSEDKFTRSVLPRTYDFGFATEAAQKDVHLYFEAAEQIDAPRSVARAVDGIWERFLAAMPGTDFTAMHRYVEEQTSGDA